MSGILKSAMKPPRPGPSSHAGPSKISGITSKSSRAKGSVSLAVRQGAQTQAQLQKQKQKQKQGRTADDGSSDEEEEQEEGEDDDFDIDEGSDEEMGTDEEIELAKSDGKSIKKTTKRKRPTTAEDFGATLTSLLADPLTKSTKSKSKAKALAVTADKAESEVTTKKPKLAQPVNPILALSAHRLPTKSAVSLEARAKRQLRVDKEEKEDKARVRDVVEGWASVGGDGASGSGAVGGQEFEKGLRKVAQRGVIKLFNAILLASKNAEAAHTSLSAQAGIKPDLPKRKKEKDNILGRGGKEDVLTKESFLDLVRKGSTK